MTSQIFANIYLNEFDRFVRHKIKPLGYVRYGDDFVIFLNTKATALEVRELTHQYLNDSLMLLVHKNNDVITKVSRGILYLGHKVYPNSPISIDDTMRKKILEKAAIANISSYSAMNLSKRKKRLIPWIILKNQPKK